MNYKRTKNNVVISVKKWDNNVTLTDLSGKVLAVKEFSDHVKAVAMARAL